MIGSPKYNCGDIVSFKLEEKIKTGTIAIVDSNGTFANPNEVQYDILNEQDDMLYKHVPERFVASKIGEDKPPLSPF